MTLHIVQLPLLVLSNMLKLNSVLSIGIISLIYGFNIQIIVGKEAKPGQFPFQVLLRSEMLVCGGVLFHDNWVLTAAHCIKDIDFVDVHLGLLAYNSTNGLILEGVTEIIRHEDFNKETLKNDIALIKLPQKVISSDKNITAIKLFIDDDSLVGQAARLSGWGITKKSHHKYETLQYATLRITEISECSKKHGRGTLLRESSQSSIMCAKGDEGQNTCMGDSGGPLVMESQKLLIGIQSYGGRDCEDGGPTGFTRVSSFTDWIIKITELELR